MSPQCPGWHTMHSQHTQTHWYTSSSYLNVKQSYITCWILWDSWSGDCHVFTPKALRLLWLLSTSPSMYTSKTNCHIAHKTCSLSFTHTQTELRPSFLCVNVDTVNNWRWHSKVNLAPPQSHFSLSSGGRATSLVCLSALTDTPLPARRLVWLHFHLLLLPWRLALTLG